MDIAQLLSKKQNKSKLAQARAFVKSQVVKKADFEEKMDVIREKEEARK